MRRLTMPAALCLTLLVAGSAGAQDLATGKWSLAVDLGSVGGGTATFTLTQDGEKVTGRYSGALGEADVTGTIKGNEIQFSFATEAGTVTYTGKIVGDTLEGTCVYGQLGDGRFKGSKVKT